MEPQQPPHSEESERAVLAAALLDPERVLVELEVLLAPTDFYYERHQKIYRAMVKLRKAGSSVDLRTVQAALERDNSLDSCGGLAYLATLDEDLPDMGRVTEYAEIVKDRALLRSALALTVSMHKQILTGGASARDTVDDILGSWLTLSERVARHAADSPAISTVLDQALLAIETRSARQGLPGLSTGIWDLDDAIYGLVPGNLGIIAGRPGSGKSALASNILRRTALAGHRCLFFSLEMTEEEVALRLLSEESGVPYARLFKATSLSVRDWSSFHEARARFKNAPLLIQERSGLKPKEVTSIVRREHAKERLDLVVIDYLQLLDTSDQKQRWLALGQASAMLKSLAKELRVPVVCLSQLSRDNEKRAGSKRPQLSDLRESGNIEQDADWVLLLHHGYEYGEEDAEKGFVDAIVAKNRNGPKRTVKLFLQGDTMSFVAVDRDSQSRGSLP